MAANSYLISSACRINTLANSPYHFIWAFKKLVLFLYLKYRQLCLMTLDYTRHFNNTRPVVPLDYNVREVKRCSNGDH
jgi:hypothetical protein